MQLSKLLSGGLALALCAAFMFHRPSPRGAIAYSGEIMPAFHVKDLAKAKRWYADVLGFEVVFDLPEQGWCELATPSKDAKLGLAADEAATGSNQAYCAFGVQDMAAAKATLVKHGVALEGDVVELPGLVKLLYFRDPEQNRLMFFQSLEAASKPAEASSR
jgi:catechol 2,3-dioxygenase-like lactoylglutathione lyase family enzyme